MRWRIMRRVASFGVAIAASTRPLQKAQGAGHPGIFLRLTPGFFSCYNR